MELRSQMDEIEEHFSKIHSVQCFFSIVQTSSGIHEKLI